MSEPVAYFLTWTTYCARLHGDKRGSIDARHNAYATPALPCNPRRVRWEASLARSGPFVLKDRHRELVREAIREHCCHKGWELHALAVQTNHVHVVVENAGLTPEQVMTELKAWATRQLRRTYSWSRDQRVWTTHGSTRYLWNAKHVADAVSYVQEGQGILK